MRRFLVCLLTLLSCSGEKPPPAPIEQARTETVALKPVPSPEPPRRVSPDWAAIEESEKACADCHPEQVDAWLASKMGQSFARLPPRLPPAPSPLSRDAQLVHPLTGLEYSQRDGVFTERASETATFQRPVSHRIGSGSHASSYAWTPWDRPDQTGGGRPDQTGGGRLYQSPLTYFSEAGAWALSPGYEAMTDHPGSFRELTPECLFCHAGSTTDRLPVDGMGCSRCHGDAREHAQARLQGRDGKVTLPTKLSNERQVDVCAACHFGGAARLLRDGRSWGDFMPGDDLSETVAIFVRSTPGEGFGTNDHLSRLERSACAKGPTPLLCTTCHAPHPSAAQRQNDRSQPCRACHSKTSATPAHACSGPAGSDCASCHMDVGQARNIPHISAVDHFIRRRPERQPPRNTETPLVFAARRQADPTSSDDHVLLGRAYVEVWRSDGQTADAERAERHLKIGLDALPLRVDGWLELAALRRLRGQGPLEREAAERAYALAPTVPRVARVLAAARMGSGDAQGALTALSRLPDSERTAEVQTLEARALQMVGKLDDALKAAEAATRLQPTSGEAFFAIGVLALELHRPQVAMTALRQASAWLPRDLRVSLKLGQVALKVEEKTLALEAFERALALCAKDATACQLSALGRGEALLALGRADEALLVFEGLYESGVRLPTMPSAMGRTLSALGRYAEAVPALEAAAQIRPDDPTVFRALDHAYTRLERHPAAARARDREAELLRTKPSPGSAP